MIKQNAISPKLDMLFEQNAFQLTKKGKYI